VVANLASHWCCHFGGLRGGEPHEWREKTIRQRASSRRFVTRVGAGNPNMMIAAHVERDFGSGVPRADHKNSTSLQL
jgi:hypothetical protein